jgi:hypothetical protein
MTSIPFGHILLLVESASKAFRIPRNSPPDFYLSGSLYTEKTPRGCFFLQATRQGFEPRLTAPKTVVLPLDDRVR